MATPAAPAPPRVLGALGVVLTLGLVVVVGVVVSTIVALQLV